MIYFVSDGEYVKIGFTEDEDISKRIRALQTGNARKLELVAVIPGDTSAETALHRVLSELRVSGEWFKLSGEPMTVEQKDDETGDYLSMKVTPAQLRVLEVYRRNPSATKQAIADEIGISRQAVSKHMAAMNGFVK